MGHISEPQLLAPGSYTETALRLAESMPGVTYKTRIVKRRFTEADQKALYEQGIKPELYAIEAYDIDVTGFYERISKSSDGRDKQPGKAGNSGWGLDVDSAGDAGDWISKPIVGTSTPESRTNRGFGISSSPKPLADSANKLLIKADLDKPVLPDFDKATVDKIKRADQDERNLAQKFDRTDVSDREIAAAFRGRTESPSGASRPFVVEDKDLDEAFERRRVGREAQGKQRAEDAVGLFGVGGDIPKDDLREDVVKEGLSAINTAIEELLKKLQ